MVNDDKDGILTLIDSVFFVILCLYLNYYWLFTASLLTIPLIILDDMFKESDLGGLTSKQL